MHQLWYISASEVTTVWCYINSIMIIIIRDVMPYYVQLSKEELTGKATGGRRVGMLRDY